MGKKKNKVILAIDPGTRKVGWAIFLIRPRPRLSELWDSGSIQLPKQDDWIDRIDQLGQRLTEYLDQRWPTPDQILIELPTNFTGTGRGQAATNSGSVNKLIACVFQLKGMFKYLAPVELVPVRKWKGNTKKHVTELRIFRHWAKVGKTNDESDAIGIGDWYIRYILKLDTRFTIKGDCNGQIRR